MVNKWYFLVIVSLIMTGCVVKKPHRYANENVDISQENLKETPSSSKENNKPVHLQKEEEVQTDYDYLDDNLSLDSLQESENNLTSINDGGILSDEDTNMTQNQTIDDILKDTKIYFDFDKYNIRNDMIDNIEKIANIIKNLDVNYTLRIEGNTDEWGTDEYNYALGLKRAKSVKNALVNLGINKDNLKIVSYGEGNPVCLTHTDECWAKNRRVEFTLFEK